MKVAIDHIANPRIESEEHYYNPVHTKLVDLGLAPHLLTSDVISGMLKTISSARDRIDLSLINPSVRWRR